jgi:hypothetical protein
VPALSHNCPDIAPNVRTVGNARFRRIALLLVEDVTVINTRMSRRATFGPPAQGQNSSAHVFPAANAAQNAPCPGQEQHVCPDVQKPGSPPHSTPPSDMQYPMR